jgi:LPS sulfotransferase NodH
MKNTHRLGLPKEFFNQHIDKKHLVAGMADPPPPESDSIPFRCALVDANGTTPNSVASFKVFPGHLHWLLGGIRLTEWFPSIRWIHLHREDKVGQAISWSIARQTEVWWGRRDSSSIVPVYSATEIEGLLLQILAEEADWAAYFLRNQLNPLRISYEELVSEPVATIGVIAEFLGVDLDRTPSLGTSTVKQRGELEEEWRARFFADAGSLDRLNPPFLPRYAPRNPRTLLKFFRGELVVGPLPERLRE